jgi:hypothetical protein
LTSSIFSLAEGYKVPVLFLIHFCKERICVLIAKLAIKIQTSKPESFSPRRLGKDIDSKDITTAKTSDGLALKKTG